MGLHNVVFVQCSQRSSTTEHWKRITKITTWTLCVCRMQKFRGWRTLFAWLPIHLVMMMKLTMIKPLTFQLKRKKKLHNACFEPSYCLSLQKQYKRSIKKCGTSPRPSEPHEIWLFTSQTQTAHITQSKLKPATHSLFDSLLYNHLRWHCSRGLHILLIPAHLSCPHFNWQCCISPAHSGFCWCRFCNEPVGLQHADHCWLCQSYGKATERHWSPNGENVWLKNDIANEETTNGVISENACRTKIDGHICC